MQSVDLTHPRSSYTRRRAQPATSNIYDLQQGDPMNQYLLSVHDNDEAPPAPDVMQQMFKDVEAFNQEVRDAGMWVFAGGLLPPESAKTVRSNGGKVTTTDGPYAETKEHIGGFWIIKAEDEKTALEWAARGSAACRSAVEVRPFQDEPEA